MASVRTGTDLPELEQLRLFERIAATSPDILFVFDLDESRNVYANARVMDVLGYSVDAFTQKPVQGDEGLVHPDDRNLIAEWLAGFDASAAGAVREVEHRVLHADGAYRWLRVRASVSLRSPEGRVTQVVGTAHDVTEEKRAAFALHLSEERLRFGLEASGIGAWDLDLVTHAAWRSLGHDRIFGYAELLPEWTYEAFLAHVVPDDRAAVDQAFSAALAGSDEWAVDCQIRRADGAVRWVAPRGRVSRDSKGAPVRMYGTVTDITQRKDDEAALRAAQLLLQNLIDNLPELAWSAEPDGFITFYNRRWYEYTGTTVEQMAGWGWKAVHDPSMVDAVTARWQHSIESGEPFEMEFPLRGADGKFRWFLTRVTPLRDAAGTIVRWIGTNTNVHEQRVTRERTEALLAEVSEQSRAMAEVIRAMQAAKQTAEDRLAAHGAPERSP